MSTKLQKYQPTGLSRIERLKLAVRSYWMGQIASSDHGARNFFAGAPTSTGVDVNEFTALNYSAVFAAVGLISSQVGNLPLLLYRKVGEGKERFERHPLYRLVHDRPNPDMSAFVFRETLQAHVLTWGNGYAEIVRDGAGRPSALWPITPDRVAPFRRGSDAALEYRVVNQDGSDVFIPAGNMLHVPGHGFNGITGYSVIAKMRESVSLGLAAERFGGTFFGNGAQFGGVISVPTARPSDQVVENDRKAINAKHQGVDKAHRFLMLYNGATYAQLGIPPNDAQFLETRIFQVAEIARWFNLPPHKLKELTRSTNNNIEHQNLEYYIDCLAPWLEKWEQELCEKLISPLERTQQSIEFVADGLLRGDAASRGEFNSKQFSVAMLTPNEGRKLENRNPLTGGDTAFVPLNMIPLHLVEAWTQAEIDSKKADAEAKRRPPPAPVAPGGPPDPSKQREIDVLTDERNIARTIAQANEDLKDRALALLRSAEQARDVAVAESASLRTMTEGLSLDVVAAQRALDEERDAHAETTTQHETALAEVARVTAQQTETLATTITEREHERSARAKDVESLTARADMIEGDYQRVCEEKLALHAQVDTVRSEAVTARMASEAALREAQAAHAQVISDLRSQIEHERSQIEQAQAERDAARAGQGELRQTEEIAQAVILELRAQIGTLTAEVASGIAALTDAREAVGRAETAREAASALQTTAVATSEAMTLAAANLSATLNLTKDALRGVLRDTVSRLVGRESDRARKAQSSPEKLAKWAEAFYPMHEDVCRTALRPVVKAWLVASGTDLSVDQLLERVVPPFIAESTRQLRGLAAETDLESLAPALERVLRRWDTERPDALVDRIVKEAA